MLAYLDALQAGQVQPPGAPGGATSDKGANRAQATGRHRRPGRPRPERTSVGVPGGAGYRPPVYEPREGDVVEPFTRRRKLIAEHMVYSKTHSPHVGTLAEVDLTRVMRLRNQHKDAFAAQEGFALTLLPLAAAATVRALKESGNHGSRANHSGAVFGDFTVGSWAPIRNRKSNTPRGPPWDDFSVF